MKEIAIFAGGVIAGAVAYFFVVRGKLVASAQAIEAEVARRFKAVESAIKGK